MKTSHWIVIMATIVLTVGCSTPRKLGYMLDLEYHESSEAKPAPELVVQRGDKLEIKVFSPVPELTAPFRAHSAPSESLAIDMYEVDREGFILFPTLGLVSVEGQTLKEAGDSIAERIRAGGYINEPTVRVRLANFTVTVIGSAGNTIIPVEDSDINLLQVIARTGGTDMNDNIREVTVIRTEAGIRTAYQVNLQSRDLFNSPVYYLKQHDVVYVKPQGVRLNAEGQMVMSFVSAGLSLGGILSNFLLWSNRR